ncbi:MAG: hypothetical protein CMM75_05350 [Rhodospirillaceae bacterium]|nr:hypothetical protein [Rhodospirillaceae bacterium]
MRPLKRFTQICMLSVAFALSACLTTSNNLDSSDKPPEKKNADVFQPTPNKLAGFTKKRPSRNATKKTGMPLKPISLAQIVGQNKKTLTKILGPPSFKRSDHPAEIWRYHDKACLLDIYLYQPLKGEGANKPLVNYIEARTIRGPRAETLQCLNIIRHRFVKSKFS